MKKEIYLAAVATGLFIGFTGAQLIPMAHALDCYCLREYELLEFESIEELTETGAVVLEQRNWDGEKIALAGVDEDDDDVELYVQYTASEESQRQIYMERIGDE